MKPSTSLDLFGAGIILLAATIGSIASAQVAVAADPRPTHESRLAELEKLVSQQQEVVRKLTAQLATQNDALKKQDTRLLQIEARPYVLGEGEGLVPVNSRQDGRYIGSLQVRLPEKMEFDPGRDRILLTAAVSQPSGHFYSPLLVDVTKDYFRIQIAEIHPSNANEKVAVHWVIIRQPRR